MNKEDILTWMINFGREWTGLNDLYQLYKTSNVDLWTSDFRDMLGQMHDAMFITKRTKLIKSRFRIRGKEYDIQHAQYRLTERAIKSLEEA